MANFQSLQNIQALILKYLRGELSDQEQGTLQEWIDASPANKKQFEELTNSETLMEKVHIWHEGKEGKDRGWQKIEQHLQGRPKQLWFRLQWTTIAAAVLFLVLGTAVWFMLQRDKQKTVQAQAVKPLPVNDVKPGGFKARLTLADGSTIVLDSAATGKLTQQGNTTIVNKDGQLQYDAAAGKPHASLINTLSTANGQTYKALLSDGSTVYLNTGSSIRYPVVFTGNERIVEITGEVYFEVAKDRKHPFKVITPNLEIEVLGTKFNVNTYSDEAMIRTTLLEGSVRIASPGSGQTAMLKPGQQAQLVNKKAITVTSDVDTEEVMAWKDGKFIFNKADFKTVMRQLARWYNVEVVYAGASLPQTFSGSMQRNLPLSAVLKYLERAHIQVSMEGRTLRVLP